MEASPIQERKSYSAEQTKGYLLKRLRMVLSHLPLVERKAYHLGGAAIFPKGPGDTADIASYIMENIRKIDACEVTYTVLPKEVGDVQERGQYDVLVTRLANTAIPVEVYEKKLKVLKAYIAVLDTQVNMYKETGTAEDGIKKTISDIKKQL